MSEGRMRIDKWLWAARFFKTRQLAQDAVVAGKVRVGDERVKPAKEVKTGDALTIRVGEFEWSVTVAGVAERRGPAEEARRLYAESEESIARRVAQIADRKAFGGPPGARKGRPTKRDRRLIIRFREGG
ncbi:MAG: RNA-binding protein [Betaproteobacteria bacterium]|nr:RNA-binding protein [Betaproteobacteria bacterium]